mgnify:CR=1 FL=1
MVIVRVVKAVLRAKKQASNREDNGQDRQDGLDIHKSEAMGDK